MLRVMNNNQVDEMKRQEDIKGGVLPNPDESKKEEQLMCELASRVRTAWDTAKRAKTDIEAQMLKSLRQKNGQYEPEKLAAIKSINQPEVYVMATDTKCRSAEAWVKEIIFQPNEAPWDISPTPVPELPVDIQEQLKRQLLMKMMALAYQEAAMAPDDTPGEVDPQEIFSKMQEMSPDIMKAAKILLERKAKDVCKDMKQEIEDQLVEGGWYEALEESIFDVITMKAGFVKGPVFVKKKKRTPVSNPLTGLISVQVQDEIIPQYSYASPFDIYPAPNSNGIDDLWLIHHIQLTPTELNNLLGAPGFRDDEIREVLDEYRAGGLKEWTAISTERKAQENKDSSAEFIYEKIDALEYWGSEQGKVLLEWGMPPVKIPDADKDYNICCWLIGRHVIKAMLNPDPLGQKPFSKASFVEQPNSFWGKGLPEVVADLQGIINAIARALVNNVGMASGPMIERNIDRIPPGESKTLWPWKVWDVTDAQMGHSAPALQFYQPQMFVEKLVMAYKHFAGLLDEHSGVPAYAHGDPNVGGGAGRTASGLSMLMSGAARGIKQVIKAIDAKIIKRTIERQYYWNIEQADMKNLICDYKIHAKGTSVLLAKEQQSVRRTEFLTATANPIDSQLMGPDGRRYLLKEVAKSHELDTSQMFPDDLELMLNSMEGLNINQGMGVPGTPPQPAIGGAPSPPAPATLDAAGAPVVGTDTRLFNPQNKAPAGAPPATGG